jgi:hypothetical protein
MSLNLGIIASSRQQAAPLLLDQYPGAAAAYSLRKLRTAYTGAAIRVRRASDNSQIDIGFNGSGALDTTLITTFCGVSEGFITKWYDQSGNSRDGLQLTNSLQPRIYFGTTININGVPAVDVSVGYLTTAQNGFTTLQTHSEFISLKGFTNATAYAGILSFAPSTGSDFNQSTAYNINQGNTNNVENLTAQSISYSIVGSGATNIYRLITSIINNQNGTLRQNNILIGNATGTFSTSNTGPLVIGTRFLSGAPSNSYIFPGYIQEIISYNTDQSSNRTGIETNINSYYTIY